MLRPVRGDTHFLPVFGLVGKMKSRNRSRSLESGPQALDNPALLGLAEKVRQMALELVGDGGERTIEKQYQTARTRIERGDGLDAIREMVDQNGKAISLLKGADMAAMFEEQVRPLLGSGEQ